ncbi:UV radiation resistance protein and autophagy-related subunit 14-domain-containing protein [Pilobolus umbonatus]|nr:UV radiation resistance protein and autophagy-related subunit 14-domain-containing protein [Pilobolus umbonatus]
MDCHYCHTSNRKFYCFQCIREKLQKHSEELHSIVIEKDTAIDKAKKFLSKASKIQALLAEKNRRVIEIESIQEQQRSIIQQCSQKSSRIHELRKQIDSKRKLLDDTIRRKPNKIDSSNDTIIRSWQRTHKMVVGTRRILVKEVVSLFDLKPGIVGEQEVMIPLNIPFSKPVSAAKEDLYICGVTLPTRLIDVSKYPKEELNAPIGLIIHMLSLIVRYLDIKLPFIIFHKGIKPYIKMGVPNVKPWHNYSKMPLFLDDEDKNFRRFTIGMAMLNYDIAYLCFTQGVEIPLSQVANTLQGLLACCNAPELGVHSHALIYEGIRGLDYAVEFQQVLKMTALRYRCGSPQYQLRQQQHGLNDNYFKVKSNGSTLTVDEMDNDDDDELYLDSDEEESDHENLASSSPSEHWNLVDVMPSFGGRANNGNEGESIFQIGAATILPGVMNMMESLGRNNHHMN